MNIQQYISDNGFQREDLLAKVAESLELDKTRAERMERAYKAIYEEFKKDKIFFSKVDFVVYPQGSKAIGTTLKPIGKDEFDLDIVIQINDPYHKYTSSEIYNHLIRVLENSDTYRPKLKRKNRCARINYAGDFHMDILPGCIIVIDHNELMVPDRELKNFTSSNPKDYANWFNVRAESVEYGGLRGAFQSFLTLAKSEQEELPNEDFYIKEPLKRSIQLTKRYRDIFFQNQPDYKTSSIILTTIFGELYNGESSIYMTIENVLNRILEKYNDYDSFYKSYNIYRRIKVLNPVNPKEDFTEKWDDEPEYYRQFITFIRSYKDKWEQLKADKYGIAEEVFGSSYTKLALSKQIESLSKGNNRELEKSASIIFSGNTFVDENGNINKTNGYKSKSNRNFGGIYEY